MKKLIPILFLLIFPVFVSAASIGKDMAGRILINSKGDGRAWFISPTDNKRYGLDKTENVTAVVKKFGVSIKESDWQKIAQSNMPVGGDKKVAKNYAGKIVIQTEKDNSAWYINPFDLKKYYLGKGDEMVENFLKAGTSTSQEIIAKIHKPELQESIDQYSSYEHKKIKVNNKTFTIDVVTIDLRDPNLKIITDTADNYNCKKDCKAKPLLNYAIANKAFAAINATYFCDSKDCVKNYYFYPVYNSNLGKMINEDQLKYWTTGPIMAFDVNNKFYYFKDSREFKSVADFEKKYGVKLQAAIGNRPRLIEKKMNLLLEWDIDSKQRNSKASRNAIAYKDNKIYLVISYSTTVVDLADIMQAMDVDYALNLDGGYSSALFYNDEYMVGPGRDIPNAIIFSKK